MTKGIVNRLIMRYLCFVLLISVHVVGIIELSILKNVKLFLRQLANLIEATNVIAERFNNERNWIE